MSDERVRDEKGKFISNDEPKTAKLSMRVEPSLLENIKSEENWQERAREALKKEFPAK